VTDPGAWGSDGKISMPVPIENPDVAMADFEGFCFTPDGIRVNLTSADRDELIRSGFGPSGVNHAQV
jgi:hypothetical protein